ncbi:sulfonate ABC transporter substrate-binding protein [Bradyrhizobium viridifuturi]|jgi:sulfonate transport system substrate-binding protein|uniref:sulfonate ABC transporter substrate-binding protein n=1 Tax=Bradyrhizobium TaxID=374 RepID=UPI000396B758|nr:MULTISPECIES: sulfonate ABC transporter substrate-binding protein [Bradyrhizobium]ERF83462.1 MAG: aliphatic sulfonates family ABC transporter substrate-binding protein [Bradyrhizobium sp. DFCI-1]OYU58062.1 MAG: sulfonate ABC transporter substrate-binding protein [Bradyrhizobium sp. PARBB1]PSO26617.1 sulfonate ABC transporter substrate-binding protein [Bradyrhizobium sp. MOS004]QRI68631.1 sulfonate ABC transporter substrate-binding protein [Bradyrhizobium sp. PSBB068]MBR1021636.1 sulfonate A
MTRLFRRWVARAVISVSIVAATVGASYGQDKVVRIGFQKYGKLVLLKSKGSLEQKLKSVGYSVVWTEFPSGPPLLEALNVGAIDFGNTGEAPPIFAQAAGAPIQYVAYEPPAPKGEAILVPKDSPIKSVTDLKGKKVALNKGSNVHYLLVKALEKAGVKYSEIEPVFLAPADARAAFERGAVDAWVIWDPFQAAAEAATGARTVADGTGVVANYQFYFASKKFLQADAKIVELVLAQLSEVDDWAKSDIHAVAEQLAPNIGLSVPVVEVALKRQAYGIKPVTDAVIADQQQVADTFFALGLIPKQIKISDVAWRPGT